jgi:hypothetical protein
VLNYRLPVNLTGQAGATNDDNRAATQGAHKTGALSF